MPHLPITARHAAVALALASGLAGGAAAQGTAALQVCTPQSFTELDAQISTARADGARALLDDLVHQRSRLQERCRYRSELEDGYRELARLEREIAIGRGQIADLRNAALRRNPPPAQPVPGDAGRAAQPGQPLDPDVNYDLTTLHAAPMPGAERTAQWERQLQAERRQAAAERRGAADVRGWLAVLEADAPTRQRALAALERGIAARKDEAQQIERVRAAWAKQREGTALTSE
ncbi:hypothetical protein [Xylophilus sp.]|uniref:hypothetical protein n=1 Tax=Xylophilus sp. TaxID=2653893 RepID=UPI0013BE22F6|nr:hypothetical protein [Xylophilus sp.]KAF1044209.1 MAG: hypothetical protein GAK38_03638 [Xylophilus sp.]